MLERRGNSLIVFRAAPAHLLLACSQSNAFCLSPELDLFPHHHLPIAQPFKPNAGQFIAVLTFSWLCGSSRNRAYPHYLSPLRAFPPTATGPTM